MNTKDNLKELSLNTYFIHFGILKSIFAKGLLFVICTSQLRLTTAKNNVVGDFMCFNRGHSVTFSLK